MTYCKRRKKIIILPCIALIIIIIAMCIGMQSEPRLNYDWRLYQEDIPAIEGLTMTISEAELIKDAATVINITVKNDTVFPVDYFLEDVHLQQQNGDEWLTWKPEPDDQASAELMYTLSQGESEVFELKMTDLVPYLIAEPGTYRVFWPMVVNDGKKWPRGYTSAEVQLQASP